MADEIMQGAGSAGIETAAYVVLVCAVELCGLENSIWGRILFASGVCRELGGLEMCGFVLVGAAEGSCALAAIEVKSQRSVDEWEREGHTGH